MYADCQPLGSMSYAFKNRTETFKRHLTFNTCSFNFRFFSYVNIMVADLILSLVKVMRCFKDHKERSMGFWKRSPLVGFTKNSGIESKCIRISSMIKHGRRKGTMLQRQQNT